MAGSEDVADRLSPEDAFAVLGNETRLGILRALGEADGPVAFSELYDGVDVDDSGQFNYHLDKLVGHFVHKGEDGYFLREPGQRVVEAVLSGAVTETPEMERTGVDLSCRICEAPVEARWIEGSVELYCTSCDGAWSQARGGPPRGGDAETGYLGRLLLPPAGLRDRDPDEVVQTAWTWTILEILSSANGICPRCSGPIERTVSVCTAHEYGGGVCESCHHRYAITASFHCTNCVFSTGGSGGLAVIGHPAMFAFLSDQGFDPIQPADTGVVEAIHQGYTEEILGTDPLDARFTFEADSSTLILRVDEELNVTAVDHGESGHAVE